MDKNDAHWVNAERKCQLTKTGLQLSMLEQSLESRTTPPLRPLHASVQCTRGGRRRRFRPVPLRKGKQFLNQLAGLATRLEALEVRASIGVQQGVPDLQQQFLQAVEQCHQIT